LILILHFVFEYFVAAAAVVVPQCSAWNVVGFDDAEREEGEEADFVAVPFEFEASAAVVDKQSVEWEFVVMILSVLHSSVVALAPVAVSVEFVVLDLMEKLVEESVLHESVDDVVVDGRIVER
jgi:hypothetical protein